MDNKTKNTGRIRRFLLRLLGPPLSKAAIARVLRGRIDTTPAAFPADLNRSSDILFILPQDRIEMIFQLENIFLILGRYKNSALTFICPAANSPFVSGLKNTRVIKYDPQKFLLYSVEFGRVVKELTVKSYDICIMLEKQPALTHLYMAGISRAHLRIGLENLDNYPFINVSLVSAEREDATLWERNLGAAKFLNAEAGTKVRWGVQKSTMEEVAQMLSERKLKKEPAPVCVDLASLEGNYGKEWCAELLRALKESKAGQFCIFSGIEGDPPRDFGDTPFPALPPMSIPRVAALMAHTDLVITGPGALLGLAQISSCKIVPVLTGEQALLYCKNSDLILPVTVDRSQKPGGETVRNVIKNVKAMKN